jgi:superfamily I DNA/RNA helicase
LDKAQQALIDSGVKVFRVGGAGSVTETSEFRALRGYMRLAVNVHDRRAFMAIAAAEHITEEQILEIKLKSANTRLSLAQVYAQQVGEGVLPKTLAGVFDRVRTHDQFHDYPPAIAYMNAVIQRECLTTPQEMVDLLACREEQDELIRAPADSVTLSTIHSSKGLQWPTVFLVGMNSAAFPSPRAVSEGRLEEERRLCYVGMTRAEDNLFLVHNHDSEKQDAPSVFFRDAGYCF